MVEIADSRQSKWPSENVERPRNWYYFVVAICEFYYRKAIVYQADIIRAHLWNATAFEDHTQESLQQAT